MRPLLTALFLASASLALAAADFEGTVTFKMTNAKGLSHSMKYSLKGHKTRVDLSTPKGGGFAVIVDTDSEKSIMVMDERKVYVEQDVSKMVDRIGERKEKSGLKKTGKTEDILGYPSEQFIATTEKGDLELWAAQGLGAFHMFRGGPAERNHKVSGWEKEFIDKGYFPLRIKDAAFSLEATQIEKKSLPDSLFEAPAGYKKMSMGGKGQGGDLSAEEIKKLQAMSPEERQKLIEKYRKSPENN